jgi:uncharacterized protein (DUF58 family)
MTARGWWCLFSAMLVLVCGILRPQPVLTLVGLTMLLWLGWEWLFFAIRVRTLLKKLRVERQVCDERGPVTTLWAGRGFTVRAALTMQGVGRLPYVAVTDPVPFAAVHEQGATSANGELRAGEPLRIEYRIHCPLTGLARFEGLRVEVADLHGFFAHATFVRAPVVLRILPGALLGKMGGAMTKRHNELPPPGVHRLRLPGSGSELLDLRDYIPGDPPRTIAWKLSARRDRLITKEFESEVPVRCTLFLDVSSSVRVPSPVDERPRRGKGALGAVPQPPPPGTWKPLDQLVEVTAGVVRASIASRDLAGLCLFDEQQVKLVRPERTQRHANRLMQLLGEAAALGPVAARADPEALTPIAYALAQEVYPDLLRSEVNHLPAWWNWLFAFPGYTRHRRRRLARLHYRKGAILLWGTTLIPLAVLIVNVAALFVGWLPDWSRTVLGLLLVVGAPLLALGAWVLFLFSMLVSWRPRRQARLRKRLSAILAARYGPLPGGLEALLEDDDLYSLYLQQFLAEHQVPCAVPLYDPEGRYLFNRPEKLRVLARAMLGAAAHARDNELFVIVADLLELDGHLAPLLQAVRVALGRHHQVVVLCAWPRGVPLPGQTSRGDSPGAPGRRASLQGMVRELSRARLHAAYERIREAFAGVGVPVACAGSDEAVPLIVQRLQRLRTVGGRR